MPLPPNPHAIVAITLAIVAIYLFTRERYELELSSLWILILVLVWFELFPFESDGERVRAPYFLAALGNEALITVVALMLLAKGLVATAALQPIGHALSRLWRVQPQLAFLATLVVAATLSMFINNTPVVVAVLPLLMAVSLESRTSPSGILMPVGYATIIGGMATTIGTSTNLLVTSLAADFGVPPFGLFDFAAPVLLVGSIAILYLWLIAPRLLPDRRPPLSDTAPRLFQARLLIEDDSPVAGGTLAEALARTNQQMKVARITRGELSLVRLPLVLLKPGDCLHVRDTPERLKEFERQLGATLIGSDTEQRVDSAHPLRSAQCLAEVVVTPGSRLDHETLNSTKLLYAYGVQPLALHQPGKSRTEGAGNLANERLLPGDVLLLQGEPKAFERLKRSSEVLLLDGRIDLPRTARAPIAALVMIGVVTLGATGLMRLSIAAVAGVGLLLATRCLTARQALEALDRRIILVIVASLAVGNALMLTGGAEYIAALYVAATQQLAPAFVLAGLMLIMAMLTEVATNNAIALIGTPIAISVARQLGVPAEPFVLAVLYGANMSYLTPTGYQTNLLVMSAGGYRFSDFVRAGLPLQIIMWLGLALVLPIIYDL